MEENSEYINGLITEVLFTSQGERNNQPDFGIGLKQIVFEPTNERMMDAWQSRIQQVKIVGDWIKLYELGNPDAVIYEKVIRKAMPISITTYISSVSRLHK